MMAMHAIHKTLKVCNDPRRGSRVRLNKSVRDEQGEGQFIGSHWKHETLSLKISNEREIVKHLSLLSSKNCNCFG